MSAKNLSNVKLADYMRSQSPDIDSAMYGVYAYFDKTKNLIVYIGVDEEIRVHKRHRQHCTTSKKDEQAINAALQDAPDNFVYIEVSRCASKGFAMALETALINQYKPEYNVKYLKWTKKLLRPFLSIFDEDLGEGKEKVITLIMKIINENKKKEEIKNEETN